MPVTGLLRPFNRTVALLLAVAFCLPAAGQGSFQGDINRWTGQDALDPVDADSVLFVGSSSIRRWEKLTFDFADYKVLQRGFGGARLADVNFFVNDIVLPYNPSAIVMWAGTNDINSSLGGGATAADAGNEVVADFQQFVSTVHTAQPDTPIFYLGIMPTPGRISNGPAETVANTAIAGIAASDPNVYYIDLPAAFNALNPPNDPAFTSKFVDSIHLNRDGYDLWTSVIRPQVEAVIAPNKVLAPNPNTPQPGSRLLFDFGPSNPEDGDETASPDGNGNHWNNWPGAIGEQAVNAGEHVGNLVDSTGAVTGVGLTITGGFLSNGKLNGGLFNPDPGLLGDLAIETATQDYFFTTANNENDELSDDQPAGFMLDGLDPNLTYDFHFFGSRTTTAARRTEYEVLGANSGAVELQTSGFNIGANGVYDGNDDELAVVEGIRPDAFGQVFVDVTLVQGSFAYLNALMLEVAGPAGDYNGDLNVDAADYSLWRDGASPDISTAGFDLWASRFGANAAPAQLGVTTVPEPTIASLLLAAGAGLGLGDRMHRQRDRRTKTRTPTGVRATGATPR